MCSLPGVNSSIICFDLKSLFYMDNLIKTLVHFDTTVHGDLRFYSVQQKQVSETDYSRQFRSEIQGR